MSVSRWTPFHDVNRFFDDVLNMVPRNFGLDLAIDLYQDDNNLIAEMSAPGIDINNTEVNVIDDILKIHGHREEKKEKQAKNFYSKEIHYGSFERNIRLPTSVIAEDTKANYHDGILKIIMPIKKITPTQKRIAINKG